MYRSNFNRHQTTRNMAFHKTRRRITGAMILLIVVRVLILTLVIGGCVLIAVDLHRNDSSLTKEFGKSFENVKQEFNSGRQEVAVDTLVLDSI